ncbi:MAG: hypothetical protein JNJ83_09275 [Verrucomicrobiaceae bacterium]|nr:hypothetical protein [Verrucomicrobiaceae bacterium]
MRLHLQRTDDGSLRLSQHGLSVIRLVIGLPILALGLVMLYGSVNSVIPRWQQDGFYGLPEALVGSVFLLLFATMLVPLGWWIVFARRWIILPKGGHVIIEGASWLIGQKEHTTSLEPYRSLRVALERVDSSPSPKRSGTKAALCHQIRLLAHDADRDPSIELGAWDESLRQEADSSAQEIAAHLGLPIEVGDEHRLYESPAAENEGR